MQEFSEPDGRWITTQQNKQQKQQIERTHNASQSTTHDSPQQYG
jgi:hypothetical protein